MHAEPKDTLTTVRRQFLELECRLQDIKVQLWPGTPAQDGSRPFLVTGDKIERLLKARRLRERQLGPELFADPAWDILLEAFAASLGQRRLTVSSLCDVSAVPTTTALRWIKTLQEAGWLKRRPDPLDGRRHWVELTATAEAKLQSFFEVALPTVLPLCTAST